MENVVSNELDYSPLLVAEPEYEFTRIFPQSGTTSTQVSAGGNDVIFEIPATKAFNFGKSWFQFQFTLPQMATKVDYAFADFTPYFRQVQVYTRGSLMLMDHTNFHLHSKMVTKINKKLVETMNSYNSASGAATQSYIPCYSSNTQNNNNLRYTGISSDRSYTEPAYIISGTVVNTAVTLNVHIPFSELYESILAVDKDIMLNETLLVRFVWSELPNIGFGADATGPQTNPVPLTAPGAFNVNNMELHLAIERNLDVVNNLQSKIASADGFSLMIPYCFQNQVALTGTNQSVTIRVNRQNGLTLERIYHSVFLSNIAANYAIYNNSTSSTNLQQFYTNLNNRRLEQNDYFPANLDDYKALRPLLLNSTVQTPNIHYYNWCWVEEFGDGCYDFNQDNVVAGIDLNLGEQKWDFVATLSAATNLTHQSVIVV